MILSCGDALIDFLPMTTADGREACVPAVGGSCLNVAIAIARLGVPAGFVGGLSTDVFGEMISAHASASHVDLRHATRSAHETTLAFVRFIDGEPHYLFYDEATAARSWAYAPRSVDFRAITAVHTGSTTLIHDSGAKETLALLAEAKDHAAISFDPNCRPHLVTDRNAYRARMDLFASRADIVRMSDADFDFLYGGTDFDARAQALLANGASLVVVTRGSRGVVAWHKSAGRLEVGAQPILLVDTIGAGDSFQGALLATLGERNALSTLPSLAADDIRSALAMAIRCAGVTCSRAGADPPWRAEIDDSAL